MSEPRLYRGQSIEDRRLDRRRRFCESGLALFGTAGFAATSVATVCKHASLSSRQFYVEFDDRESLLRTIYDQIEDAASTKVEAAVTAAFEAGGNLDEVLDAGISVFVEHFAADPRRTRLCFVEVVGVSAEFERYRAERRTRWADLLSAVASIGIDRGLITEPADPLLWTGFIGAVNTITVAQSNSPELTSDDTLRAMRTLLHRGVLG
ncbi:TetR/AcrR family transcriptional regulator [Gordonia sp. (in: high G+C Gram-positive bacteria)]|uniref:TetR/AcrR family transcriptional regulator n=1 Tax=Gordonia sp. (in: high G+C Gram-positive bacteria) TaxID=84139 RepID=UPI003C733183